MLTVDRTQSWYAPLLQWELYIIFEKRLKVLPYMALQQCVVTFCLLRQFYCFECGPYQGHLSAASSAVILISNHFNYLFYHGWECYHWYFLYAWILSSQTQCSFLLIFFLASNCNYVLACQLLLNFHRVRYLTALLA